VAALWRSVGYSAFAFGGADVLARSSRKMVPGGGDIYNSGAMSSPDNNLPALSRGSVSLPRLAIAISWALVVAFGGGVVCGLAISRYGEIGAVLLAACGAFGGFVSHKITQGANKVAAFGLALATLVAYFVAETCWIHWNTDKGEPSWWAAVNAWPLFIRDWELAALIGAACAVWGAWLAYGYAMSPIAPRTVPTTPAPPPP
jgi:hypothetical protein